MSDQDQDQIEQNEIDESEETTQDPIEETAEEVVEKVKEDNKKPAEETAEGDLEEVNEDNEKNVEDTSSEKVIKKEKTEVKPGDEAQQNQGQVTINDDMTDTAKWYVGDTYAGHEKKVAVSLKQRAIANGFADRIFKIFIPHQKKIVISEGKKRSVDERLFPGYVIVLMDMSDDAWLLVRSTRGVTGFVGMGSTPTPLPEQEVKTLMKFTKMDAPKFEAKYSVGDSVKIMEGPFRDFLGKVEEVNEDQGKVKVLISFFGKETPVELDFVQVQNL